MPKKKRRKVRFKKGQEVFLWGEKGVEKVKLTSKYYDDDHVIVIQPDDEDEGSSWVEAWQVGATKEELVENVCRYADYSIAEHRRQIKELQTWKKVVKK
jgi:hypothetical protein